MFMCIIINFFLIIGGCVLPFIIATPIPHPSSLYSSQFQSHWSTPSLNSAGVGGSLLRTTCTCSCILYMYVSPFKYLNDDPLKLLVHVHVHVHVRYTCTYDMFCFIFSFFDDEQDTKTCSSF